MSLHAKVMHRLTSIRSSFLELRRVARDDGNKAALDTLVADLEAMMANADAMLITGRETGAPAPEGVVDRFSFPFADTAIGGSFPVEAHRVASCRAAASAFGKRNAARFVVRLQADGTALCFRMG